MKKSFTLIELLVVVAIIAILAAILLPSLNKARERARASSCVSNLKNIGIGSRMYSDEQKDWIVPNNNGTKNWYNILSAGYTGDYDVSEEDADKNIYTCPSADLPAFQTSKDSGYTGSHYTMNQFVSGARGNGLTASDYDANDLDVSAKPNCARMARRMPAFKSPQAVKFVLDNQNITKSICGFYADCSYRHGAGDPRVSHEASGDDYANAGDSTIDKVAASATTNCLFLDGHVESINWGDMRKKSAGDNKNNNEGLAKCYNLIKVRGKGGVVIYDITDLAGVLL